MPELLKATEFKEPACPDFNEPQECREPLLEVPCGTLASGDSVLKHNQGFPGMNGKVRSKKIGMAQIQREKHSIKAPFPIPIGNRLDGNQRSTDLKNLCGGKILQLNLSAAIPKGADPLCIE